MNQSKNVKPNKVSQRKTSSKKTTVKKLSLAEKQAIKLQKQKERQAQKIAMGELEPKNKDRFYCTSAELTEELVKWRDSNTEEEAQRIKQGLPIDYTKRKMSEKFGNMLIAIADKMLNRSEFRNYSKDIKEEAKSYFFLRTIRGLKNYNFEFNNPFAYFTTCAWNAYISVIARHYRDQNLTRELLRNHLIDIESYGGMDPNSSLMNYIKQYLKNTENELMNDGK